MYYTEILGCSTYFYISLVSFLAAFSFSQERERSLSSFYSLSFLLFLDFTFSSTSSSSSSDTFFFFFLSFFSTTTFTSSSSSSRDSLDTLDFLSFSINIINVQYNLKEIYLKNKIICLPLTYKKLGESPRNIFVSFFKKIT